MKIVLKVHSGHTIVEHSPTNSNLLRAGTRFVHADLPRSIEDDRRFVALLSGAAWDGVHLFRVEGPADIEKASTLLRIAEANRGMPDPSLSILASLDTDKAALGLDRFDRTVPRLAGFVFDAGALALVSGAAADSDLVGDLRLRLPLAARASRVAAILTTGGIDPEVEAKAARDGYDGLCLGPA